MEPDPLPPAPADETPVPPLLPERVNPCAAAPDVTVEGRCLLCGRAGRGWSPPALATSAPTSHPLRCDACYQPVPSGALYCGHCGRRMTFETVETIRAAHAAAGRFCPEALADRKSARASSSYVPTAAETRRALQPVREVMVFYTVMLLPILFLYAWSFHVGKPPSGVWITGETLFYAVIIGFALHSRKSLAPLFSWPQRPKFFFGIAALTPVLTLLSVTVMHWLIAPLFPKQDFRYSEPLLEAGYPWWAVYVDVAVLPAFFEEIAFRGIILKKFQTVMPATQALLVTALLFAIVHYNFVGLFFFLVPLALAAGWTVQKSGSLLPAMLIHFLHNTGVVLHEQLNP